MGIELTNKEKNRQLLSELYEHVCNIMHGAHGTSYSEPSETFINGKLIQEVVGRAIRDSECKALDAWRSQPLEPEEE